MVKKFPFVRQLDVMDCGAACLSMVCKFYGQSFSLQTLRQMAGIGKEGSSLAGLMKASERTGFKTFAAKLKQDQLLQAPLPAILHWGQAHYVVLYKVKNKVYYIADPASGKVKLSEKDFLAHWLVKGELSGVALLLEPSGKFYERETEKADKGFSRLLNYLNTYKSLLFQVFISLFLATILGLILPFLTQALVDTGIQTGDYGFIYLVCIAQLMVFSGRTVVDIIRTRVLLHISSRISISLLADFMQKLMGLPAMFFDTRKTADIMQRMQDHKRVESFLTNSIVNTLFSVINLLVFSIVLLIYSLNIALIFFSGTLLSTIWVLAFMKKRKQVDYNRFLQVSENQNFLIETVQGMHEIKLNGAERYKRWEWEEKQAKLFRLGFAGLNIEQYLQGGALFIGELKNILIVVVAASLVLSGELTLGMMLSVSYITGQLNSPVMQFIEFFRNWQDARISFQRMNEIFNLKEEDSFNSSVKIRDSYQDDLIFKNVSFKYDQHSDKEILSNIDLLIPKGKVTAIVGTSGSGKTTLIKLMLKFLAPGKGSVKVGLQDLKNVNAEDWRQKCGAVLQGGYIFSDTLAANIALGEEIVNEEKLLNAARLANIDTLISDLPSGFHTKIGIDGVGLSEGQKQRVLIARAIYRDPCYLFFDEATNSLDANNEREITERLNTFFKGKTVVVVAHRLSTVRHADQIVVLDKGRIIEQGSHDELIVREGSYFNLIKNQLELGK